MIVPVRPFETVLFYTLDDSPENISQPLYACAPNTASQWTVLFSSHDPIDALTRVGFQLHENFECRGALPLLVF
jgi:hypothetical protein